MSSGQINRINVLNTTFGALLICAGILVFLSQAEIPINNFAQGMYCWLMTAASIISILVGTLLVLLPWLLDTFLVEFARRVVREADEEEKAKWEASK